MVKVVLDTSVLVAGLRSRGGASHRLLELAARGSLRPLVSTALFLEYEAVLLRPETRLATGLAPDQVEQFLAAWASASEPVEVTMRWRPQLRDPGDEMVLEVAVNGRAEVLVTHNTRDFTGVLGSFGIRILTPGQFLREVEP